MYNDSKYLALSVYTLLCVGVIVVAIQASGAVEREALFVLRSLLIIGCTMIIVLFLFAPKVYYQVQKVDKYMMSGHSTNSVYLSRRVAGAGSTANLTTASVSGSTKP
jgi:tellurite resistance protein TehA-like permease